MNAAVWIGGIVALGSTVLAITRRNAVHALLYLIVAMLGTAVLLFAYGAAFAAVLQVVIWAGAIMVLFLFVMMMLSLRTEEARPLNVKAMLGPALLALIVAAELIYVLVSGAAHVPAAGVVTPKQVGVSLYGPYAVAVELASVLLLVGVAGAFHLGRQYKERDEG